MMETYTKTLITKLIKLISEDDYIFFWTETEIDKIPNAGVNPYSRENDYMRTK